MAKKTATVNSQPAHKQAQRSRGTKTTWSQYLAIVEWLEVKANFNLVVGAATSGMKTGVIAGAKLTKKSGYVELAEHVNQKCGVKWDYKMAESRYRAYVRKHKKTSRAILNPGGKKFCLGENDRKQGIKTIEQKVELKCPNFKRMDVLFGGRQNVTPHSVLVCGKRPAHHREAEAAAQEEARGGVSSSSSEDDEDGSEDDCDDDDDDDLLGDGNNEEQYDGADFTSDSEDMLLQDDDAAEALASLADAVVVVTSAKPANAEPPAEEVVRISSTAVSSLSSPTVAPVRRTGEKKTKRQKTAEDKTTVLPAALRERCAETVASATTALELTSKITEMKNNTTTNGKGGKKDFTTTYAEAKAKEIELEKSKFDFEKENFAVKRDDEHQRNTASLKQDTQKAIIVEMIRKGHSAQEIKDFCELLL